MYVFFKVIIDGIFFPIFEGIPKSISDDNTVENGYQKIFDYVVIITIVLIIVFFLWITMKKNNYPCHRAILPLPTEAPLSKAFW